MTSYTAKRIDLSRRNEVEIFLNLPYKIYRDIPQWVPPLRIENARLLDPQRNPYFKHSDAAFFLVLEDGSRPVSRLACLNNKRYNSYNNDSTAFFYLFESLDLPEAAQLLFSTAAEWVRAQGLKRIIGPKGFSPIDGQGLLVEGFEYPPAFGVPYNPPWYAALLEQAGFTSKGDVLSGFIDRESFVDPKIPLVAARVQERWGLRIAQFRRRRDLQDLLPQLKALYNQAIQGTAENYPIDEHEARSLADQLLWFADPRLIKIIYKGDTPVGFLFAYPDISKALRRTKGRILPFGWLDLLVSLRTTATVNINGAGMIEKYRGSGGIAILFNEISKTLRESRFKNFEIVQVNERMVQELLHIGVSYKKKHRMYTLDLKNAQA